MTKNIADFLHGLDPLLYGHNPAEHVVAVHQLNDQTVRLYKRDDGNVSHEDAEFFPFFFLSDETLFRGFPKHFWLKELGGNNFYKYLVAFKRWSEMWEGVHFVLNSHNNSRVPRVSAHQELDSLLLRPDPTHQFLLQTGVTLFKGMAFQDLVRLQIDSQTYAKSGRRSNPQRKEDRLLLITIIGTDGGEFVLDSRKMKEQEMLEKLVEIITQRDPDVIEGHHLFSSILPYLVGRSETHGVDLSIGREGAGIKQISGRGGVEPERSLYEVVGRHLIDTVQLAESYDGAKKALEAFSLPHLAEHFGIGQSQRVVIPSDRINSEWEDRPNKVVEFSLQNCRDVQALSEHLSASNFYLSQICPFPYGTLARLGAATKVESLLVREYLRQKRSLPKAERGSQSIGGYTDIFMTGVIDNVLHADVESLYPSIMVARKIAPRTDELRIFTSLLQELTAMRLDAKRRMQRSRLPATQSKYDALQLAYKLLINSFYGYLGYSKGIFNDYQQADAVTSGGQEILRAIIQQLDLFNARLIEVDTDGLYFIPPDNVVGEQNEKTFIKRISDSLPQGINLVLAGRFKRMMSYRKKNYALLDLSDSLIVRGSSLISRALERFARRFIQRCIECLLTEDFTRLHHTYASFHTQILKHQWQVVDFCRTEIVRENLETYTKEVSAGRRTPSAALEAARRAGIFARLGDYVSYYVTGSHPDVKIIENCRIAEEWDPNLPDENTQYYLDRLNDCSNKFRTFFDPKDYERIFSMDDLFGFSPEGIGIVNKSVSPQPEADELSSDTDSLGIWLEE